MASDEKKLRLAPIIGELSNVSQVWIETCKPDDPHNPLNPKGTRTWNHVFHNDITAGRGRLMRAVRVMGEEVGNHFHPRVENKDPEIFIFLHGDVEIRRG